MILFVNSRLITSFDRSLRQMSLLKHQRHNEMIAEMKRRSQERAQHGFGEWQVAQKERYDKLHTLVTQLDEASANWITESNLDDAVDNVVDQFFIVSGQQTELANHQ